MNKLLEQKASHYVHSQDYQTVKDTPWTALNQAFIAGAKTALTMEWPADQYVPEKDGEFSSYYVVDVETGRNIWYPYDTDKWNGGTIDVKTWRLPLPVELLEPKSEPTQLERLEKMAQDLAKQIQQLKNNQ